MSTLTEQQQQVVDLIRKGKTVAEIAEARGTSDNAVYVMISRLREKGVKAPWPSGKLPRNAPARNNAKPKQPKPTGFEAVIGTARAEATRLEEGVRATDEKIDALNAHLRELEAEKDRMREDAQRIQQVIDAAS